MPNLPTDLWSYVTTFLSVRDAARLAGADRRMTLVSWMSEGPHACCHHPLWWRSLFSSDMQGPARSRPSSSSPSYSCVMMSGAAGSMRI